MNKLLVIARREIREVLRAKGFWIGSLAPIAMMALIAFGEMRHTRSMDAQRLERFHAALRWMGPQVYLLIMFISTWIPCQMLLTSLIEEKSSRMVEVLLSTVSPIELMAGKILGLFVVGLASTVVNVAVLAAFAGSTGLLREPNAVLLALFIAYYLLGFAMQASLYAAVGAAFNELKDTQAVIIPLAILLALPLLCLIPIAQDPGSLFAVTLSILPPTAPGIMVVRLIALPSPPWRDVICSLLLAVSVPLTVWAAAKVFRTGVLLYGKAPRLAEICRWARSS